jgi:drug/metabolite transporter (DMT)-like permease
MKVVWRMTGTSILLMPVTAHDVYTHGFPKLSWQAWATFLLATISYTVMTLSFVISLTYTTVGNAVVLANSLPLILLVGKLLVGQPITWMSGCGALVAFGGTALCSKDSAENLGDGSNTLLGDGLAIVSAFAGVGYLVFAKSSRSHMSMYLFMFLTMALGAGISWIFQIFVLGETSTFDMDYHHGLWGFLLPVKGRLPLELVIVVVCNLCGTMGYVRVMQYFDNLVISSAALMEPVIAEFLSFGFGVGALPGLYGWIGNALVAGGTFAVLYEDAQETKSEAHIEMTSQSVGNTLS